MSEYIRTNKFDTNECPNIFVKDKLIRTNVRIYIRDQYIRIFEYSNIFVTLCSQPINFKSHEVSTFEVRKIFFWGFQHKLTQIERTNIEQWTGSDASKSEHRGHRWQRQWRWCCRIHSVHRRRFCILQRHLQHLHFKIRLDWWYIWLQRWWLSKHRARKRKHLLCSCNITICTTALKTRLKSGSQSSPSWSLRWSWEYNNIVNQSKARKKKHLQLLLLLLSSSHLHHLSLTAALRWSDHSHPPQMVTNLFENSGEQSELWCEHSNRGGESRFLFLTVSPFSKRGWVLSSSSLSLFLIVHIILLNLAILHPPDLNDDGDRQASTLTEQLSTTTEPMSSVSQVRIIWKTTIQILELSKTSPAPSPWRSGKPRVPS